VRTNGIHEVTFDSRLVHHLQRRSIGDFTVDRAILKCTPFHGVIGRRDVRFGAFSSILASAAF
jgi:hypothetical protein